MTATSATGGSLPPSTNPAPVEDGALVDLLQAVIAQLSGIPGNLVRPRWQPEPPNLPANTQTWAAIGITSREHESPALVEHLGPDGGADLVARQETMTLLCSFYGPAGDSAASLVRDGLSIAQNRDVLAAANIALIEVGNRTALPELINGKWYDRTDMPVYFRRAVVRQYPVLNLQSAGVTVRDE